MRRGCLSVGTVSCDICKRKIPYPERYVMVDEDAKGHEVEKGGKSRALLHRVRHEEGLRPLQRD